MKILIAEDEPISRLALEATVPQWGFVPVTVANGQEALARLTARNDPPPIAILDWMMPGMDGVDVCRAVRSVPASHLGSRRRLPVLPPAECARQDRGGGAIGRRVAGRL